MNIAVSLKQFVGKNRTDITRELRELEEATGGGKFQLLSNRLEGLDMSNPDKLNTPEGMTGTGMMLMYPIFVELCGVAGDFRQGTCLGRMAELQGTLDKQVFQSFLTQWLRAQTAYAFRIVGSSDELAVKVRDEGVLFLREGWNDFLAAEVVISEYFVDVDCTGSGETLRAILGALNHSLTTAVGAFMSTLQTGEGWTPVVSEQVKAAQAAYALVEAWVSTLDPQAQALVMKHPKALELLVQRRKL